VSPRTPSGGDSAGIGGASVTEAPAVEAPPTLRLSYSRLSKYQRCGEAYRLQYVEQVPTIPSGAALAGSAVHTVIEEMVMDGWYTDPRLVETQGSVRFVTLFTDAVAEIGGVDACRWGGQKRAMRDEQTGKPLKDAEGKTILVGEDFAWFCKMGPTFVKRAGTILRTDAANGLRVIEASVERQVTAWLDEDAGVQITGIIDVMLLADDTGFPTIRDWKTGTWTDAMQLATYGWLLEAIEDDSARIKADRGEIAYLRGAGPDTWIKSYDLSKWKPLVPRMFRGMVQGLGAGIYQLQPSSFCGSCWVKDSCDYGVTLP